jgi:hypothetical protein
MTVRSAGRRARLTGVGCTRFGITLLIELESMGFFARGEAGPAIAAGALGLGGRLPTNTRGWPMCWVPTPRASRSVTASGSSSKRGVTWRCRSSSGAAVRPRDLSIELSTGRERDLFKWFLSCLLRRGHLAPLRGQQSRIQPGGSRIPGVETETGMTAMVWQRALPGPLQTRALRVALRLDPAAREDWERWVQATPGLKYVLGADRKGVKRILALIYHGLRRNEAGMDPEARTYLRTAYARVRTRTEVVRRITRELLELFRTAGIPNLVLKGMLAAETAYPEASLRHCHDLDLWIAPPDTKDAGRVLAEAGYRANSDFPNVFQHASGFPVSLQHRLFRAGAPRDNPTPPGPSQQRRRLPACPPPCSVRNRIWPILRSCRYNGKPHPSLLGGRCVVSHRARNRAGLESRDRRPAIGAPPSQSPSVISQTASARPCRSTSSSRFGTGQTARAWARDCG